MPLSPMLVQWLSENGHDALHAAAIGLHRAPDTEIMSHAKDEGRIVVTADLDYPRLLALSAAIEPSLICSAAATGTTTKSWPEWPRYWARSVRPISNEASSSWSRSAFAADIFP
jgi:hypothetical protein